jgi:hypothetical protein
MEFLVLPIVAIAFLAVFVFGGIGLYGQELFREKGSPIAGYFIILLVSLFFGLMIACTLSAVFVQLEVPYRQDKIYLVWATSSSIMLCWLTIGCFVKKARR